MRKQASYGYLLETWREKNPKQKVLNAIYQSSIFLGLLLKSVGVLWSYFKEGTNRMSWNQLT